VKAAGLAETLSNSEAELTVFAPTDAAFAELGQATIDGLLADIPALTDILLYHVVDGAVGSADLKPFGSIRMLNGKFTRSIFGAGGARYIKGIRNSLSPTTLPRVVTPDVAACKSVIHVIDGVLLP